jgi:iron complex outermembrane receptor protein
VDQLDTLGFASYTELDLGLGWEPTPDLELSIAGRNLLDAHHPEQAFAFSASGMHTEVERSVLGRLKWRF